MDDKPLEPTHEPRALGFVSEPNEWLKGQEVVVDLVVDGQALFGLDAISIIEVDGVATTVWRVRDVADLIRVEAGVEIMMCTNMASPNGSAASCLWSGRVKGLGIASRTDYVTLTIEGIRRNWIEL